MNKRRKKKKQKRSPLGRSLPQNSKKAELVSKSIMTKRKLKDLNPNSENKLRRLCEGVLPSNHSFTDQSCQTIGSYLQLKSSKKMRVLSRAISKGNSNPVNISQDNSRKRRSLKRAEPKSINVQTGRSNEVISLPVQLVPSKETALVQRPSTHSPVSCLQNNAGRNENDCSVDSGSANIPVERKVLAEVKRNVVKRNSGNPPVKTCSVLLYRTDHNSLVLKNNVEQKMPRTNVPVQLECTLSRSDGWKRVSGKCERKVLDTELSFSSGKKVRTRKLSSVVDFVDKDIPKVERKHASYKSTPVKNLTAKTEIISDTKTCKAISGTPDPAKGIGRDLPKNQYNFRQRTKRTVFSTTPIQRTKAQKKVPEEKPYSEKRPALTITPQLQVKLLNSNIEQSLLDRICSDKSVVSPVPEARSTALVATPKPVLGGRGTMKRRKQLREFLIKKSSHGEQKNDELFLCTGITVNMAAESNPEVTVSSCKTPKSGSGLMELNIAPSSIKRSTESAAPESIHNDQNVDDKYIYNMEKWKKGQVRNENKKKESEKQKATSPKLNNQQLFGALDILKDMHKKEDADSSRDEYFSESDLDTSDAFCKLKKTMPQVDTRVTNKK